MIQVQLIVHTNGNEPHNLTLVSPEVGEHVWNHTHFFSKEECPARIIATKKGEDDVMTKYHVIIFFSQKDCSVLSHVLLSRSHPKNTPDAEGRLLICLH